MTRLRRLDLSPARTRKKLGSAAAGEIFAGWALKRKLRTERRKNVHVASARTSTKSSKIINWWLWHLPYGTKFALTAKIVYAGTRSTILLWVKPLKWNFRCCKFLKFGFFDWIFYLSLDNCLKFWMKLLLIVL